MKLPIKIIIYYLLKNRTIHLKKISIIKGHKQRKLNNLKFRVKYIELNLK